MPKVTVLIPVYNGEAYLRTALDSVVSQTLRDLEIIVCNNGSTDSTLEIAEEYASLDDRIVIRTHANLGQGPNLVDGLKLATGDYIGEVDADDYIDKDMYRQMLACAEGSHADVVKCHYSDFTEKGIIPREVFPKQFADLPMSIRALPMNMKNILIGRPPCIFCGLYRREFLLKNHLFFRAGKNYEDTSLSFKIAVTANKFIWYDRNFYFHRMDNPTSGTNTLKDFEAISEQYDEIRRYNDKMRFSLEPWINTIMFYTYQWMMSRCLTDEDKIAFFKIMRRDFTAHKTGARFFNTKEDYELYSLITR